VEFERDINVNGVVQSERRDKKKWEGPSMVSLEFKGGGVKNDQNDRREEERV